MAGETLSVAAACRDIEIGFTGEALLSFSDIVFGFLDCDEECLSLRGDYGKDNGEFDEETEEDNENTGTVEERQKIWATQSQLLEGTLCRTSSMESKIRNATKEAVDEVRKRGNICSCRILVGGECRICFMRQVSDHLRSVGINCTIRKTKWRHPIDIPSGEHTFLDVVHNSASKKGKMVRIIIELNFRTEFEMAKANEEYNKLVRRLPNIFVGKVDRLLTLINIMCMAAKKCMKEKKMHIGPWRKQRYMQAKWLGSYESSPLSVKISDQFRKPKASLLTVDLMDKKPNLHFAAVKVI